MSMIKSGKLLSIRNMIRIYLLLFSWIMIGYSLQTQWMSYGFNKIGVIRHCINCAPWLILFLIDLISLLSKRIAGVMLIVFSIAAFFFYGVVDGNSLVLQLVCLPIFASGLFLLIVRKI